jgi:Flp pilus assembly protein CpaB
MKPISVGVIAVVCLSLGALLGVAGVQLLKRPPRVEPVPQVEPAPEFEKVQILVARQPLAQWSRITEPRDVFDVKTMHVPRPVTTRNLITADRMDEPKGKRLKKALAPGEWLTEDHVLWRDIQATEGHGPFKGPFGVPVKVRNDKGDIFILPGNRVDVVHTVDGVSKVLLENTRIAQIDPDGATVLVEVATTNQVLELVSAREKGPFTLVLRSSDKD